MNLSGKALHEETKVLWSPIFCTVCRDEPNFYGEVRLISFN